jgi:hypothetical protein
MYWPLNHQVSPEDEALKCTDCHTRENSRLAGLTDFYMPGRDANPWVDNLGVLILLLTLVGVLGHGALRIYFTRKQK